MPIAFDIESLRQQHNCKHYFETGLWDPIQQDISSWKAVESNFDTVHCIELRKDFVDKGNILFKEYIDEGKYHLYNDDSTNMKKYLDMNHSKKWANMVGLKPPPARTANDPDHRTHAMSSAG